MTSTMTTNEYIGKTTWTPRPYAEDPVIVYADPAGLERLADEVRGERDAWKAQAERHEEAARD